MKKEDVKIGNIVFYKKNWDGFITQAKVIELKPSLTTEDDYYVKLKNICHPELTKKDILYNATGITFLSIYEIYKSMDELKIGIKKKENEIIQKYKSEIKNINDLINFPFHHCFCGEEYTDYEAIQAYKERAMEFGFNVTKK